MSSDKLAVSPRLAPHSLNTTPPDSPPLATMPPPPTVQTGNRTAALAPDRFVRAAMRKAPSEPRMEAERARARRRTDQLDPSPAKADRKIEGLTKVLYRGPLVKAGIKPSDVVQGAIGDCFVPSAFAAMARFNEKELAASMRANEQDGTYTFTFQRYNQRLERYVKQKITIDGELWVRGPNDPLYGDGNAPTSPRSMEMWFPLWEKAYAIFCGQDAENPSYESLAQGGFAENVMEAVLGKRGYTRTIASYPEASLWREITRAVDQNRPAALGTHSPGDVRYSGTGLHADHSYSVMGYGIDKDGDRCIYLRNPWGESEPGADGKDDGYFEYKLSRAYKYFATLSSVKK